MKKILAIIFMLSGFAAMAQEATAKPIVTFQTVLIGIIIVLSIVMIMVVFTLQQVVNLLKRESMGEKFDDYDKLTFWERMLALKPLSAEKDIELDHDYDGIKELNNPIPPWFNVLFYGTIIFAIGYLIVYHVMGLAPLQAQEYDNAMAEAKVAKELYVKNAGNLVDENSVKLLTDATLLKKGHETFEAKCVVCHGEKGEGKVGPNLTDKYWLHGGNIQDVFKTIKYGVPSKGMVSWENSLNGSQMEEVASYILSLQGTNPPGAKAPQGDLKVDSAAAPVAPADTTLTATK